MMTRRQFSQVLIGSGVAALGWRAKATGALEECQGEAYAPWRTWSKLAGLERAVAAATLAASPHNTQPWLFRISGSRVELFADHNRTIGTIDPLLREQHIGIGCALENLLLTAESSGYAVKGLVFDQNPASGRIASVEFMNGRLTESTLYRAIPYRHTNRGPYQNGRTIPAGLIQEMERLNADRERIRVVMWTGATQSRMKDLIVAASEQVVADKEQNRDSNQWYRGTRPAIDLHRDGITLDAQGLSGVVRFAAKMMPEPSPSFADQVFLKNTKDVYCATAAALGTIAVAAPWNKEDRVRVGRLWQRMHLWATANGIAMQPLNQVHERADREKTGNLAGNFTQSLAGLLNDPDWSGVFTFRMGYAERPGRPSPRRDFTQVML